MIRKDESLTSQDSVPQGKLDADRFLKNAWLTFSKIELTSSNQLNCRFKTSDYCCQPEACQREQIGGPDHDSLHQNLPYRSYRWLSDTSGNYLQEVWSPGWKNKVFVIIHQACLALAAPLTLSLKAALAEDSKQGHPAFTLTILSKGSLQS